MLSIPQYPPRSPSVRRSSGSSGPHLASGVAVRTLSIVGTLVMLLAAACSDSTGPVRDAGGQSPADSATSLPNPAACEGPDGSTEGDTTTKCNYHGTLYDDGAVFPARDGCNTCKCNPSGCMPGRWGCSLIACRDGGATDVPVVDAPVVDAPAPVDQRPPNDGPAPDYLRAEHPGVCPIAPPAEGDTCNLPANAACSYRPICGSGTPVDRYCDCIDGQWACDGGYCGGS